jgi:hypothetical protein
MISFSIVSQHPRKVFTCIKIYDIDLNIVGQSPQVQMNDNSLKFYQCITNGNEKSGYCY